MNALDPNIKISYLYRDAGNYKVYGHEIVSNKNKLEISEIEIKIKSKLIDGEFFDPSDWGLTSLQHYNYDKGIDHDWHEIEKIESTLEGATIDVDIIKLLIINDL